MRAIAAPNSAPDYCYHFDVNQWMASRINHYFGVSHKLGRDIARVFPKSEAHNNGSRGLSSHYSTMGMLAERKLHVPQNIIIFDDITSSGSQIKAVAKIFRNFFEFKGNIYGVVLGQNII